MIIGVQLRRIVLAIIAITPLALSTIAHASGASVFAAHCAVCHQSNGQGVQGVYPALAGTMGKDVHSPAGRAYLVNVVSFGMSGAIVSQGADYNGLMQPWPQLRDAEVAAVLNFILTRFNAKILPAGFKPYTAGEVKHLRAAHLTLDQVHTEREATLNPPSANPIAPSANLIAPSAMKAH